MNKRLAQILGLTLCAVLLCGALMAKQVSAEIAEKETGEIGFTTFEDLQRLCEDTYPDAVSCVYEGENPLVISGEITIPQTMTVEAKTVVVAENGNLTVSGQLAADDVVVDGRVINYGVVAVMADLTINGTVDNGGIIYMYAGIRGELTNSQNLNHLYEESGVIWICDFGTEKELEEIAETARKMLDGHTSFGIYPTESRITLEKWVSVPVNCVMVVSQELTIVGDKDCGLVLEGNVQIEESLTVQCDLKIGPYGYLEVYAPLKVEGTLDNCAVIDIYYDDGGRLILSGPGSYIDHYSEYSNLIFLNCENTQLPQDALIGLNLGYFQVREETDDQFGHYWLIYRYEIPVSGDVLWGDTNGDGVVESYDATLILRYDVGMIDDSGLVLRNMDVSGDGWIDSFDATLILQYDVGMITAFPAEG